MSRTPPFVIGLLDGVGPAELLTWFGRRGRLEHLGDDEPPQEVLSAGVSRRSLMPVARGTQRFDAPTAIAGPSIGTHRVSGYGLDCARTSRVNPRGAEYTTVAGYAGERDHDRNTITTAIRRRSSPRSRTGRAGRFLPTENQDFTVTPAEAATNMVSEGTTTNANRGLRQYSVSGLDNTKTYEVVLFDADDVTVDQNGVVTFNDDDENVGAGNDQADYTVDSAGGVIEVVNGAANPQDPDTNRVAVSPVNGVISFSVDSTTADSIVPVVFLDAEATGGRQLDLGANNQPTEEFGIGGRKTWVPAEAGIGAIGTTGNVTGDEEIESVPA